MMVCVIVPVIGQNSTTRVVNDYINLCLGYNSYSLDSCCCFGLLFVWGTLHYFDISIQGRYQEIIIIRNFESFLF